MTPLYIVWCPRQPAEVGANAFGGHFLIPDRGTWALLRSLPRVDADRRERLRSIEGLPPDLIAPPTGCKFNPRCPFRLERCFSEAPELKPVGDGQVAACWVTMKRAYAEMGAGSLLDTRAGAASGVRPPAVPLPLAITGRSQTAGPEPLERE